MTTGESPSGLEEGTCAIALFCAKKLGGVIYAWMMDADLTPLHRFCGWEFGS